MNNCITQNKYLTLGYNPLRSIREALKNQLYNRGERAGRGLYYQ